MRNYFQIIFCKFKSVVKDEFSAMALLTSFLSVNLFTIIGFWKVIFLKSEHITIPRIYQISIVLAIGLINYFFFLSNQKHIAICQDSRTNSGFIGKRGNWLVLAYVGLSFILLISLVLFASSRN